MGAETTVQYQIAISRTGAGASEAAAELKALSAAAAAANNSVTATTPAMNAADNSAKAAGKSFGAMKGALGLIAGQAFPQLTGAISVAKNDIESMRASNTNLSMSFGVVAAGVAGVIGLIAAATAALQEWYYTWRVGKDQANLNDQEREHAATLEKEIDLLRERNELTNSQTRGLKNSLGSTDGNNSVRDFLRNKREGDPNYQLRFLQTQADNSDSARNFYNKKVFDTSTSAGKENSKLRIEERYNDEIALSNKLLADGVITKRESFELDTQSDIKRMQSLTTLRQQLTEIQKLGQQAAEAFSGGFATAFVEFANGTKSASAAFADFARNFLNQMSQMLMQAAVMRALFGATGKSDGTGGLIGALINGQANGGVTFAANGLSGVSSVSSPTYFPKFNVLAGEAGREMMTVLARPRMMEVGGMQAVVGSAQGNQLAITSADQLAQRGGGGVVDIRVTLGPELRAEIVQQSVKGAVVQVAQDMRQDTPISRGVKGLTA